MVSPHSACERTRPEVRPWYFSQPGVSDHQLALVQDVMADEGVDELPHLAPELGVLGVLALQLLDGLGEPVGELDLAAREITAELVLVVAGDTQGVARRHHGHHAAQHTGAVGAPVDEVTDEHGGAPVGVGAVHVTELAEEGLQLGAAAVDVRR